MSPGSGLGGGESPAGHQDSRVQGSGLGSNLFLKPAGGLAGYHPMSPGSGLAGYLPRSPGSGLGGGESPCGGSGLESPGDQDSRVICFFNPQGGTRRVPADESCGEISIYRARRWRVLVVNFTSGLSMGN